MKQRNIIYILLLLLAASACEKKEIMTFDREEAGIYFQSGNQKRLFLNIYAYYDSISYSFSTAREDLTDTILTTRVRTMGKVRDYDRTFTIKVDETLSTAVEGVHYTAIDASKAVIPAGASEMEFPVNFLRAADLMDKRVQLVLKLEDNEHFKVYFDEQKNTNIYNAVGEQIGASYFIFETSEIYTCPEYWTYFFTETLGEWSISKMRLVNKLFDIPMEDWLWENAGGDNSKVKAGYAIPYGFQLRNYLQEQADNGTPVIDDNGEFMQLGSGYEVDYSGHTLN